MTTLLPLAGLVRIWQGATLVAESRAASVTALPEVNGRLLVPRADIRGTDGKIDTRSDENGRVAFDPGKYRIEVEDRWPGHRDHAGTVNRFPRWGDVADLLRLMDLEPAGPDLFVAPAYEDCRRNVVEGSQLLGQAIIADRKSVE